MRSIEHTRDPAATLEGVTKRYGAVTALDDLTLEIESGQVTSILGPNGAGKTTAIKLMLGLLRPTSGSVRLLGNEPKAAAQRQRVGSMMQIGSLPQTLRVRELVTLFRTYYPSPLPYGEVIATTGLDGLEGRLYGKLSGGQKQRLAFALAICGDPEVLFLDEPTVGLDVETRLAFWASVRDLIAHGRTVLLTTHYLEEADALSDRIVVLHRGRIRADGSPYQIKSETAARKIRCVTTLSLDRLVALPGVKSAHYDKAAVEVLTSDAEAVLREMLAADAGLRDLEVTGAGIEEAFLQLTSDTEAA